MHTVSQKKLNVKQALGEKPGYNISGQKSTAKFENL